MRAIKHNCPTIMGDGRANIKLRSAQVNQVRGLAGEDGMGALMRLA